MAAAQDGMTDGERLVAWTREARQRTWDLVAGLTSEQLLGPRLAIVNPLHWEIGHVAWFQEKWVLRHSCGEPPLRQDGDALWDSSAIPHDTRWDLPLPSLEDTRSFMRDVRDGVLAHLEREALDPGLRYFALYTVFHEDMHDEAFTYTRQTLEYPPPPLAAAARPSGDGGPLPGDADVPGGRFLLGPSPDEPFVFDNEKWCHLVTVRPYSIARAAVTQAEFAAFVEDGGYRRQDLWSEAGRAWRGSLGAEHPVYWRRATGGGWLRRHFDRWGPLEPHLPVIHVSWYEAEAYCRWARRRLPTEAEWEAAASMEQDPKGGFSVRKRRYPWGDEPPTPERANLDATAMGCVEVGALPAGDSAFGCRQMMGNVWEWTADDFLPYPGFTPDAYSDYSQPWFGTHKVLRGGCWVTRSRLLRNSWRNFYPPDRRDVWAGFRTCAL